MTAKTAAKGEAEVIPRERACPTCNRKMDWDAYSSNYRCVIHGSIARQANNAKKLKEATHG